ncbi:MAG: exodeoxyribonuclease VII small subunit [Oscillospiraceae bacterium]|nr:exodeoxyribonuclease VII small subunit [Oscillospiraceae bacterium]
MAVKKQSFEEAMVRLEAVVAQLEKGECGLDQSLKLFEEGAKLARQCEQLLDQAEQKVELLLANDEEVPFKGEETDGL